MRWHNSRWASSWQAHKLRAMRWSRMVLFKPCYHLPPVCLCLGDSSSQSQAVRSVLCVFTPEYGELTMIGEQLNSCSIIGETVTERDKKGEREERLRWGAKVRKHFPGKKRKKLQLLHIVSPVRAWLVTSVTHTGDCTFCIQTLQHLFILSIELFVSSGETDTLLLTKAQSMRFLRRNVIHCWCFCCHVNMRTWWHFENYADYCVYSECMCVCVSPT